MDEDLILVAAKHPLGLIEGATENAATVQALINNLVERGLRSGGAAAVHHDGAKALSKAIRRTFGAVTGPSGSAFRSGSSNHSNPGAPYQNQRPRSLAFEMQAGIRLSGYYPNWGQAIDIYPARATFINYSSFQPSARRNMPVDRI
jgi:hypothetical protein